MQQRTVAAAQGARAVRVNGPSDQFSSTRSIHMSNRTSISGLTDEEAQEFHHYWVQGLVGFTAVAVIAHMLVWAWRPWF